MSNNTMLIIVLAVLGMHSLAGVFGTLTMNSRHTEILAAIETCQQQEQPQ